MGPAAISILQHEGSGKPLRLSASVKPPRLDPGQYRLEVQVSGTSGTHTSSTPFVVGGR
jgi:hypothetical protein